VVNYYSGRTDLLKPDDAFDMSADELGRRVVTYFAQ
jgi:hypothetical protein